METERITFLLMQHLRVYPTGKDWWASKKEKKSDGAAAHAPFPAYDERLS